MKKILLLVMFMMAAVSYAVAFDNEGRYSNNDSCWSEEQITISNNTFRGNGSISREYSDRFYFTAPGDGTLTISVTSDEYFKMKAGIECGDGRNLNAQSYFRDTTAKKSKSHTITVGDGDTIHMVIWEYNYRNRDDYTLSIDFTPNASTPSPAIDGILQPIKSIEYIINEQRYVQTESGSAPIDDSGLDRDVPVYIQKVTLNNTNQDVMDNFATNSISVILHSEYTDLDSTQKGVIFAGNKIGANNTNAQKALNTTNIKDYVTNDDENNMRLVMDISYEGYHITPSDYIFYHERHGNNAFEVQALDRDGNPVGNRLVFPATKNTTNGWDPGLDIDGTIGSDQHPYMGVISAAQFGVDEIYGLRQWAQGADLKFYAMGTESFEPPVGSNNCPDINKKEIVWYVDNSTGVHEFNMNTGIETRRYTNNNVMGDIAIAPDGSVYTVDLRSDGDIKKHGSSTVNLGGLGINKTPNALSFDENGYLYVGYAGGKYYQVKNLTSLGNKIEWFDPSALFHASHSVGSAGDVLFANGKAYASILNSTLNSAYLVEIDLGADNSVASHKMVGKIPSDSYGLSSDGFGGIYVGSSKKIYKLDVSDINSFSSVYVIPKDEVSTTNQTIYGLSGVNESLGNVCVKPLSGYVYHDMNGDGDLVDKVGLENVEVKLFDKDDALVLSTKTDASGAYTLSSHEGEYTLVIDSKSLSSEEGVWMEQTYAPQGALCADGEGGTKAPLESAGICYGGKRGDVGDDSSALESAEHIAKVTLSDSDITGLDFAFSANVVVNTEDSGQGSLRQFILNANTITGENTMRFLPMVAQNEAAWWSITLESPLPTITGAGTVIDGATGNDDHNGSVVESHGGERVGVDEVTLVDFNKPELEINANDKLNTLGKKGVFVIDADSVTVKNLAIYNGTHNNYEGYQTNAGILVHSGMGTIVTENFLGVRADGSNPGDGNRLNNAIYHDSAKAVQITDNFMAYTVYGGIWADNNAYISGNSFYKASNIPLGDAITTEASAGENIIIENNRIEGATAYGIESWNSPSVVTIRNNTLIANGQNEDSANQGENGGIRVYGEDNLIEKNIITGHVGAGIALTGNLSGNKVSKNSIYDNGGLAIDIDMRDYTGINTNGDSVTANNGTKDSNKANDEMDYPVFTKVTFDAGALHIEGYVGTSSQKISGVSTVELFKAEDDDNNAGEVELGDGQNLPHGEGKTYLGTFDTENDGTFSVDITVTGVVDTDMLTATATDSGNSTSEFSANYHLDYSTEIATLVAEYRFDACEWSGEEGEVVDSSGHEHNASARNGAQVDSDGVLNNGAHFTGATDRQYIDAGNIFNDVNESFSITAWIKPTALTTDQTNHKTKNTFLAKASDPKNDNLELGLELGVNPDGSLHLYVDTKGKDTYADFGSGITVDNWHFIAVRYDGNNMKVTINNQTFTNTTTWKNGGNLDDADGSPLTIGASLHVDNYFTGAIDEVKLYTGVLDDDNITAMYNNESAGKNADASTREVVSCLEPIGCVDEAIVIDDSKYVFEIDLATGDSTRHEMNASLGGINGFGFNKQDGFIWGYNNVERDGTLIRVGKTQEGGYKQEVYGPIPELINPNNRGKSIYVGDISDDGKLFLFVNTDSAIYEIDIDHNSPTFLTVINSFGVGSLSIADMAFNPIDKQLYAIEEDNDVYHIDFENERSNLLKRHALDYEGVDSRDTFNATTSKTIGSAFFDSAGFFYAIKNTSRNVYRIDLSDRENIRALKFSSLINDDVRNVQIDGGRCSAKPIYIDYGDAPDGSTYNRGDGESSGNYRTLTSDDGPRHSIPDGEPTVFFGDGNVSDNVSFESDAREGDTDDDNGMVGGLKPLFTSMYHYSLSMAIQNDTDVSANAVGWIDFNRNGRFEMSEGAKKVINPSSKGVVAFHWDVPDYVEAGSTYIRFRVTTDDLDILESDSYGAKHDGEVEDYEIVIKEGSLYDAWDTDTSMSDRVIKTKIVNEDIVLNVASVNRAGTSLINNTFTNVKAGLFSNDDGSVLHNFVDVNFTHSNPYMIDFGKITRASKESYVKISYVDESNITREVNATDTFAIRPHRYDITVDAPSGLIAGKDFNITIEALDALGHTVSNYDENVSVYGFDYNETLEGSGAGCVSGTLVAPKVDFTAGEATIQANYDNVGKLNLKVYEMEDSDTEYALVDKNDGSGDDRYIEQDSTQTGLFSPAKLAMNWTFENGSDIYTFYAANLDDMAAPLYLDVKAQDENGDTVTNFKDGCYAEDITVDVDFNALGETAGVVPNPDTTVTYTTAFDDLSTGNFAFTIPQSDFVEGEGNETVRVNFVREKNKALEPIQFTISDVNATIAGGVSIADSTDKSATFVYLRAHVPNQEAVGKNMNVKVNYEVYCKNGNKSMFGLSDKPESEDSINWYIIGSDTNMDYNNPRAMYNSGITVTKADPDNIALTVTKLPHRNVIKYEPYKEYLLYDRFSDSITAHQFKVQFTTDDAKWSGKGKLGSTVDDAVSQKKGLQKLDW